MSEDKQEKIFYTIAQLAKALSLSKGTIYTMWREGRGPEYVLIHNKKMIPVQSVHAWVKTLPKGKQGAAKAV